MVYKVSGRRMSGDMNTAVGNCVIMMLMISAYMARLQVCKWDVVDDGDDSVLIVESHVVQLLLDTVKPFFLNFGMVMKIEKVADSIHGLEFCQSHIIEYGVGRYKFVRNWTKVVSNALSGTRHWESARYRAKVLHAVGLCELVLSLSIPVLQAFAECLLRNTRKVTGADLNFATEGMRMRAKRDLRALGVPLEKLKPQPILLCARTSFAEAFGVPIHEQKRLEKFFSTWTFKLDGLTIHPCEIEVARWVHQPTRAEVYSL